MYSLKNIILAIAVLAIFGCNNSNNLTMDKAESLMQEHPKDALALLDSLKKHPMASKAENARLALLYSMALDKNYIDVTDDSLICIAENWYSKKTGTREKFLSLYYKGVVNKNAKKYPEAITAFSRAQKLENEIGDSYLLGQLYNQMGYIYKLHYDYPKSLEAFLKAYDLYELAGKISHKNYMLLNIATAYWNLAENTKDTVHNKSEHYFKKALEEGERTKYNTLVKLASKRLFTLYVQFGNYDKAQQTLEKYNIAPDKKDIGLMGAMAKYHYSKNNMALAENLLNLARKSSNGINDTAMLYQWEYAIYKSAGDFEAALKSFEHCVDVQNKSVRLNLEQPVLEVQKQLLKKEAEYNEYKFETNRKAIYLIGMLVLALICAVSFKLKLWANRKNQKLANYVDLMIDLQYNLQHLQDIVQEKDFQLSNVYTDAWGIVSDRLNLINNLSTKLYEKKGSPKAKEIFIKEVENIIDNFRTNEYDLRWMEQIINSSNNNLLETIYGNYPFLTQEEKKLLCYIYAGFSPKAISVFLNIPIETVYNRKSRLLAKTGLSKAKKTD